MIPIVGFVHQLNDVDNRLPFDESDDQLVFWSKETDEIHKGMAFQSKAELVYAVKVWNIQNNREMLIQESRPSYWKAICNTRGEHYTGPPEQFPCNWTVTGSKKNKYGIWRISKWSSNHNCYGNVQGNNNRCLSSSLIATDIEPQIKIDIAYPIKHIQAYVKDTWNVDVTYDKAWNARRIAIERIFGTWESNFQALPKYIGELKHTNPDTIVEWSHHPASSSQIATFKYVFWAFGPPITAFQLCIPVIFVDGTHLKGSYKSKLLTALTKNANGQILPLAFAVVDEETNESWSWFLQQFRTHVANVQDRELCVISDRHKGIINAMEDMDGWHHRYCLRHVRSNFMSKFKDHQLKRLCWTIGATTQNKTYVRGIRAVKGIDPDAWKYLKEVDPRKWSLYRDEQHRRWGNLTTNIAESLNNVLRSARMLPIRACIEYTFNYTRNHFIKHYQDACNWTSPLTPRMWQAFQVREQQSTTHNIDVYDIDNGVFKVRSRFERNAEGENDFTVKFNAKSCSCGIWQNQRFPCSHAIAVCGHTDTNATSMLCKYYKTRTWKSQYQAAFIPLRDICYWREASWMIQADPTRMVTQRGRKRSRRIRNEMDNPDNRPKQRRCGLCGVHGHSRNKCPTRE
jgi:hypothetical protein